MCKAVEELTKDATNDSTKHKVYPTNLKVLEQKTTMKEHIAKLVKNRGILLNGSFWTSGHLAAVCNHATKCQSLTIDSKVRSLLKRAFPKIWLIMGIFLNSGPAVYGN